MDETAPPTPTLDPHTANARRRALIRRLRQRDAAAARAAAAVALRSASHAAEAHRRRA